MSSTNAALPKISYVKSIDVYLGTCFVMVFASLLGNFRLTSHAGSHIINVYIGCIAYDNEYLCTSIHHRRHIMMVPFNVS